MGILNQTFSNAGDIDAFFVEKTGKKYVEYYNEVHANNAKPAPLFATSGALLETRG